MNVLDKILVVPLPAFSEKCAIKIKNNFFEGDQFFRENPCVESQNSQKVMFNWHLCDFGEYPPNRLNDLDYQ